MANDPYFDVGALAETVTGRHLLPYQAAMLADVASSQREHRRRPFVLLNEIERIEARALAVLVADTRVESEGDDPVTPRQIAHDRAVRVLGPKRGRWA